MSSKGAPFPAAVTTSKREGTKLTDSLNVPIIFARMLIRFGVGQLRILLRSRRDFVARAHVARKPWRLPLRKPVKSSRYKLPNWFHLYEPYGRYSLTAGVGVDPWTGAS